MHKDTVKWHRRDQSRNLARLHDNLQLEGHKVLFLFVGLNIAFQNLRHLRC